MLRVSAQSRCQADIGLGFCAGCAVRHIGGRGWIRGPANESVDSASRDNPPDARNRRVQSMRNRIKYVSARTGMRAVPHG
jgi:hypothetical protein